MTAQNTYGIGPHTTPQEAILATFHFLRLYNTAYRKVFRDLFVGAGLNVSAFTNVAPGKDDADRWDTSPYVTYTTGHGFDLAGQRSSGVNVSVLVDSRDSSINPGRATGMDSTWRSGRGYSQGRFRGERLLYGEIEYRATITQNGLIGMVAFLNATTVANSQSGEQLFDTVSPAAGLGFRLLVSKRSRTNLCLDVGFGSHGSHGAYLAIQEAF